MLVSFADDIFIVCRTKAEAEDLIKAMESLEKWGLKINKKKSAVLT